MADSEEIATHRTFEGKSKEGFSEATLAALKKAQDEGIKVTRAEPILQELRIESDPWYHVIVRFPEY